MSVPPLPLVPKKTRSILPRDTAKHKDIINEISPRMAPKIAIVYWSLYGHIQKMAEAEAEGTTTSSITAKLMC